jgi:glycosyltransferase involved in cell wall biosynthesis
LAAHGVEVSFIVPKRWGDESAPHMRLLGCEDLSLPGAATSPPAANAAAGASAGAGVAVGTGAGAPHGEAAQGADAASTEADPPPPLTADAPDEHAAAVRVMEVDSGLTPYLTAQEYEQWLIEVEGRADPAGAAPRPISRAVARAASALAAEFPALLELQAAAQEAASATRLRFSGRYGPDLLAEVARYALAVAELARHEQFDLVHAHDWMTYPAGLLVARLMRKPLIAHMHATEYDRSGEHPNPRVAAIEREGLHAAQRVVPVSHYTAGMLCRRYGVDPSRLRVVHNAVTHREQASGWHVERVIPEPVVLFLGRVTFQKGPDYFLEAAARVVAAQPRVKFVIAGSGDMLPAMIERTAELGLARHVHFTGFLRGKDVERIFAHADLYVMPSVSEPFGITPLEAMALDTPAIVSRQSGVAEVLAHALKVDFWNVEDLADKILAVLRHPALREELTTNGRAEVARMHWDVSGARLLEVYREVA